MARVIRRFRQSVLCSNPLHAPVSIISERFSMADSGDKSKLPLNRAQAAFKASEQRDILVRKEIEKERAAVEAKTIRLKALRLAKEAADKIDAAAQPPKPKKKKGAAAG